MLDLQFEEKNDFSEIHSETLKALIDIESHIEVKINRVKNETLFLEKMFYQEIPKKIFSKYQKVNSVKMIQPIEEINLNKYDDTIQETLEKAKNLFENIKNPSPKNQVKKNPILTENFLKKPQFTAKTRKFSVENPRNNPKLKALVNEKKTEVIKKPLEKPNEEIMKIIPKPQENPKKSQYFLFRPENLQQKFSIQKESFQIYYEIRKKINSNKKEYLETLNYYKEKNIKAQSKFLNKLENHYSEKKKVLQEKYIRKEPDFSLTFTFDETFSKNVNFQYYSLQNFVKLLSYYIDEKNTKEIKEILIIDEQPEDLMKKKLSDVFMLWCLTNYFEENIKLINLKIETFFKNDYSKAIPKIREFLKEVFFIETLEKNREKKKKITQNEVLFYYKNNEMKNFKLWFEKVNIFNDFGNKEKIEELVWIINEKQIKVFFKKILIDIYLIQVNDISNLLKNNKKKEVLKEKLKILRMIFMMGMENKQIPIFYLKELINSEKY